MPDPNEALSLAERMAQVQAEARGGVVANPSTGEIIEEPGRAEVAPGPVEQPGVGTTFTPAPVETPQPVIEAVAEVIPPPEPIRVIAPPTNEPEPRAEAPQAEPEIVEPERAADGGPAPYAASTMGEIINMMERGGFSQEAVQAFQALAAGMREIADATQKRQTGTLTLKIKLTTEGDAFFMEGDYTVKAPKLPRPRTLGWQQNDGRITPSQPKQQILFGRDVGDHGDRTVRSIGEARIVRNIP